MRSHPLSAFAASALLTACPAPPADVVGADAAHPGSAPVAPVDGAAAPTTPAGGSGDQIPPGMRIEPPGFGLEKGEGVELSGTVSFVGALTGQLRVEILSDAKGEEPPVLLHALDLPGFGPWSVTAPRGLGKVDILAYVDSDQNGPSAYEPVALLGRDVEVGQTDIAGLDLVLVDPAAAMDLGIPGMRIEPSGFGLEKGEGVELSGTVSFDGELTGQLRVEILSDAKGEERSVLLCALNLPGFGPWSVTAPRGLGKVDILAYVDRDQNGPSAHEPVALLGRDVEVGQTDIAGLDLVLVDPAAAMDLGIPVEEKPPPDPNSAVVPGEAAAPASDGAGSAAPVAPVAATPAG